VRGIAADQDRPLSRRLVNNARYPDGPDHAAPGTPLVWPGSFVFGYPAQNPIDARAPGPLSVAGPYWAHNGSFLVFRRLRQDVARFAEFLRVAAAKHGLEPDALGALLLGRWRSGAPIVRTTPEGGQSPGKDNPELGADVDANNDFDYTNDLPEPVFRDGHAATLYRRPRIDPLGLVCPNSSHIRKVNPRAGYTEQGGLEDTLTRRILRRGIPYGPKLDDPLRASEHERNLDRGLHFLCYQTSIVDQFEFLTRMWLNSPSAPRGGGVDLVVGQSPGRPRTSYVHVGSAPPIRLETSERFVIPTGGEYLFVPSVYGLGKLAEPD
jgi:Dyp-type peroxidase family